jgi:hypothetical protein
LRLILLIASDLSSFNYSHRARPGNLVGYSIAVVFVVS